TGYAPVLPTVLREKGMLWRFGSVARGYGSPEPAPASPPSFVHRASGAAVEAVGASMGAVDRAAARPAGGGPPSDPRLTPPPSADAMLGAVDAARRHARGVVIAVSPAETEEQSRNAAALEGRLSPRLAGSPWLRFVNLDRVPELRDPASRIDGWNYSSAGLAAAAV